MGNIYTIYLRRPSEKNDPRRDPLYNKGCFGSTGCHSKDLLRPENEEMFKKGSDRLCFMQGGSGNTKIVFITPPLTHVVKLKDRLIIKWDSRWSEKDQRPLKYEYGLRLTNSLARKLYGKIPEKKHVRELYQHFRKRIKPVDDPDYLLMEYRKYVSEMKRVHGDEIFVNHNHETFEIINEPDFYINEAASWCSFRCKDKNCKRREKNL